MEPINLNHQHVKDQEIDVHNKSNLCHKLSHGLVMENSILNFKVSGRGIIMAQSRFYNCTFNFKTKMQYPFTKVYFNGCTFTGRLESSEFGRRPWITSDEEKVKGDCIDCDFSQMKYANGIRFIDCDVERIKFPTGEHFVIKYPYKNIQAAQDSDMPGRLKRNFDPNWLMPTENALLYNFAEMAKRCDLPVDELKKQLAGIDFIEM